MSDIHIVPVTTKVRHWLILAMLRNECRSFMTGSQEEITFLQQGRYEKKIREQDRTAFVGNDRHFLYEMWPNHGIGFGILRYAKDRWWVTGGVAAESRGRGLGRFIFTHLQLLVPVSYLEVFVDNERAWKLYASLGYRTVLPIDARYVDLERTPVKPVIQMRFGGSE